MNGSIRTSLLLAVILAASCTSDPRGTVTTSMAYGGLEYGGAGYAGVVRYRSGGSVKSCSAGPAGVLLPNRFVYCYCDQLVKDCAQDTTCTTCSNARFEQCAYKSWFSSVSYLFGDCNVSELNDCEKYCQQSCSSSCAME